ncbi:hypothetical protein DXG01_006738 [Tephrocybe rancida]|nr:hypothetical protein DXG01_006738 [Tephrocybe rancida]
MTYYELSGQRVGLGLQGQRRRANWWKDRGAMRSMPDAALQEGLSAYAEDQASTQGSLRMNFLALWKDPLSMPDVEPDNPIDDDDEPLDPNDPSINDDEEGNKDEEDTNIDEGGEQSDSQLRMTGCR